MADGNSLTEALERVIASDRRGLRTAFPGKVQSYDASKQTVQVVPQVQVAIPSVDDDEPETLEDLPTLMNVPVVFPRVGSFFMSFPVAAGDFVLVICCERDIGRWRRVGQKTDPGIHEPHGISGAVAIPGLYPSAQALTSADASNMVLGHDTGLQVTLTPTQAEVGGNTDAAALASKVDALETAFNAHTHAYLPGTGASTPTAAPLPQASGAPYASAVLKVGG